MPRGLFPTSFSCSLILHNIRSVHNVGSIFRTADGAGVSNIILSGYTPGPLDQSGKWRNDFHKVALGAEKFVRWQEIKNPYAAIKALKLDGYRIVAVEQDKRAVPIFEFKNKTKKPLALVLGNEVKGLSKALLAKCDDIVEIPMRGKKECLNVSVAAGVALFSILNN